ncbi:MFS transporter, partial [Mycobacterium sp. ITM-2017-0098]
AYATGTLELEKVPVLLTVTVAALLMAALLPVSGLLADRYGPNRIYTIGIAAYAVAVFPVFALFGTKDIAWYAVGMVLVFGVVHA